MIRLQKLSGGVHGTIESKRGRWGAAGGLPHGGLSQIGAKLVSKAAISIARRQMGSAVFEALYREQVRPLGMNGQSAMPGVFWRGHRVMALDGSALDLADEAGNAERFGYPGVSRGQAACPMLRFCALVECGTGVLIGAQADGYATGEHALAERVFASGVIDPSMLILADRGLIGWALWQKALATGAAIVCRARDNQQLPVIERLLDGSYVSEIYENQKARRHGTGTRVRVIEYRVSAAQAGAGTGTDAPQRYRLITHLLDPASAPAAELAALYQRRWKIETAFAQLKTQLGCGLALRSKTPEQRQIWLDSVLAEIAAKPSVKSRGKTHPRGIKRTMSGFPVRSRDVPLNRPAPRDIHVCGFN